MKVERIERSKHKQERVLVYLEGGNLLRITESELLRFGLYVRKSRVTSRKMPE